MFKLKIYLDTSVYSALFDERDPKRQKMTLEFWNKIDSYNLYVSNLNLEEIQGISDKKLKEKLIKYLNKGKMIQISPETEQLAKIYIKEGIIPEKYEIDALHLAFTTINSIDIIISWNFKHLVKRKTRLEVNLTNLKEGYKTIEILAPPEL